MIYLNKKLAIFLLMTVCISSLTACSPEVGSDKWCAQMKEQDKGDWTVNQAADFAKYCLLK